MITSFQIRLIDFSNLDKYQLNNERVNLINVNFYQNTAFDKISDKSNIYIKKSFDTAIKILKSKITDKFVNGPISKKTFFNGKFLGVTEMLAKQFKTEKIAIKKNNR